MGPGSSITYVRLQLAYVTTETRAAFNNPRYTTPGTDRLFLIKRALTRDMWQTLIAIVSDVTVEAADNAEDDHLRITNVIIIIMQG